MLWPIAWDEGRAVVAEIKKRFPQYKDTKFLRNHFDAEVQNPWKYKADGKALRDALYKVFQIETPSLDKMAHSLSEKPAIAVLPFDNLNEKSSQEYFADGMTDDIITDLSKLSEILVISRNSSFTYKGKPVKVQQVAKDLSVQYVLEGSVRRSGNQVRINAQLIDAITGHHLWAERYDGKMSNIFDLQDKITHQIVTALAVKLTPNENQQLNKKETEIPEAYDYFLKGQEYFNRWTGEDLNTAIKFF